MKGTIVLGEGFICYVQDKALQMQEIVSNEQIKISDYVQSQISS